MSVLTINNRDHRYLDSAAAMAAGHTDAVQALVVAIDRLFCSRHSSAGKGWEVRAVPYLQGLSRNNAP